MQTNKTTLKSFDGKQNETRFLSFIDLDPLSPTYGCADRNFWHYRSLRPFPICTFQNLSLIFALWSNHAEQSSNSGKSDFYANVSIALIWYWVRSMNKNGSFQENYQNESSFVGTAFTLYHVAKSLEILSKKIDSETNNNFVKSIKKCTNWLRNQASDFCANQNCAASAALVAAWEITREDKLLSSAENLIYKVSSMMAHGEYWLDEYGGFDPGYTTVALDYLARIKNILPDFNSLIDQIASKSLHLLSNTLSEYCPSGVNLGSRNTGFLFLYGISCFHNIQPDYSNHLVNIIINGIKKGNVVSLDALDDRYLSTYISSFVEFFYSNYNFSNATPVVLDDEVLLPKAGFLTKRFNDKNTVLQISLKRGGNMRISSQQNPTCNYSNLSVYTRGSVFSSVGFDPNAKIKFDRNTVSQTLTISGSMKRWAYPLPLTGIYGTIVNLYQAIFGRFTFLTQLVDKLLRKKYILVSHKKGINWKREIVISGSSVEVKDQINSHIPIERCELHTPLFPAHVNTNRYWSNITLFSSKGSEVKISNDRKKISMHKLFKF